MSLRNLIDEVERGDIEDGTLHATFDVVHWASVEDAFKGSLDAAKSLHDALLPDAEWFPKISVKGPHGGILYLGRDDDTGVQVNADNPARAWLLAILRALEQEGR